MTKVVLGETNCPDGRVLPGGVAVKCLKPRMGFAAKNKVSFVGFGLAASLPAGSFRFATEAEVIAEYSKHAAGVPAYTTVEE